MSLLRSISAVVFAIPEWMAEAKHVWKKKWLGYSLIATSFMVLAYFKWHLPPSGYSVVVMAVVAGIMAIRPEMEGPERSLWFVVLLCFAFIEIKAINRDRDTAKNEFESIAGGISDSINAQTGGDSFAFISFTAQRAQSFDTRWNNFIAPKGKPYFVVSITSHGKYPLRGTHAIMMDDERRLAAMQEYNTHPNGGWMQAINSADTEYQIPYLRPQSAESPSGQVDVIGIYAMSEADFKRITVNFSAPNGYWNEALHLGRMNGVWHQCLSVVGPTIKQFTHPFIYCDSEWSAGKALAEKDWVPTKPQEP